MIINKKRFASEYMLAMETKKDDKPIEIMEAIKLRLSKIMEADTTSIPEIENPVTVLV